MADVIIPIARTADLNVSTKYDKLGNAFIKGDDAAHRFDIACKRSGVAVDLVGASVFGYFINASRQTVVVEGSVTGDTVSVLMSDACYAVAGILGIQIKVGLGSSVTTVYEGVGYVKSGPTDVVLDPGDLVASLPELLAQVAACELATTSANNAASAANAAATGIPALVAAEAADIQTGIDAEFSDMQDEIDNAMQDIASGLGVIDGAVAGVDATVDAAIAAITLDGYVSGGEVQAQDTPDQTVLVPYHIIITPNGVRREIAEVSALAAAAADATYPRIDIVYDTEEGVPAYLAGNVAASPAQPATPVGGTLSAIIHRPANDNTISADDIIDARYMLRAFQSTGVVNVRSYGAVGDGVADDTRAVNAAIAVIVDGQTLFFPGGTYNTSAPIVVNKDVNVLMDGIVNYTGTNDIAVLTVGKGTGEHIYERRLVLRAKREHISDWTDPDSVSIKLENLYQCDVSIMNAAASTIGVLALGDAAGHCYNNYRLYMLRDNKYAISIDAINTGWTSENTFIGGRFAVSSDTYHTESRFGVWIHSTDDTYPSNNNNFFEKPSFEMSEDVLTGGAEAIPILITGGFENYFEHCRCEDVNDCVLRDTVQRNHMTIGYGSEDQYTEDPDGLKMGSTVQYLAQYTRLRHKMSYKIFDAGDLSAQASVYDETGWGGHYQIAIPGQAFVNASTGAFTRDFWGWIREGYVEPDSSAFMGVFVKTEHAKQFLLTREYGDTEGRVIVRPYDADMNILDGSGTFYVRTKNTTMTWYAAYQAFENGSTHSLDQYIEVTDDVKYVFIGISGYLATYSLYANKESNVFGLYDNQHDPLPALAVPAQFGTHLAGKRYTNAAPAEGNPTYWICTASGTLDTINTTCTADDSTVVTVADATGLAVGQFISIDGAAAQRIVKIDGTSITMDSVVGSGSGLGFVNSPAVWLAEELPPSAETTCDKLVVASGDLSKKASYCGASGWGGHDHIGCPGFCFFDYSVPEITQTNWGYMHPNDIEFGSMFIGTYIKTTEAKHFMISREFLSDSDLGRILIKCYDADMTLIGGYSDDYVTSEADSISWESSWAGYTDSTTRDDIDIALDGAVKYIYIGFAYQQRIRSFTVYADEATCAFSPFDAQGDMNKAYAAPTLGTFIIGRRLTNIAPSSGNPKGWICTASGTGDTISTTCTADDSAVVVVASATDLEAGQFIAINSGVALRILKVDGTSVTMSDTVAAGSGLTFVNSAPTWASEGNL